MKRAALIARISAAVVSLSYMLFVLTRIEPPVAKDFRSGWFLAAMFVAFAWVPLLLLHRRFEKARSPTYCALSFAPLVFIMGFFFILLFIADTSVH